MDQVRCVLQLTKTTCLNDIVECIPVGERDVEKN